LFRVLLAVDGIIGGDAMLFLVVVLVVGLFKWWWIYIVDSAIYSRTAAIFGGVLIFYIFFKYSFVEPPCAFWGCHVVPSDRATWHSLISPPIC
jgi:hypothetical protein